MSNYSYKQIESSVDVTVPSCWCHTRQGKVIRVNGKARGSLWDGSSASAGKLGITAPAAAPTAAASATVGSLYAADYWVAYRYIDTDGIPSSISPLRQITLSAANKSIDWTAVTNPAAGERSVHASGGSIQLFRSIAGDPDVLFLVKTIGETSDLSTGWNDGASDATLLASAAADILPVLNDDGTLCARRFDPPPTDKSVVVQFQERYWYGVDATTDSILYSEIDEPESVPASQNTLYLAENSADSDHIRALMPFGTSLYLLKDRHCYRLSFSEDPAIDGAIHPITHRGALNQRCWALLDDEAYLMDQNGCWTLSGDGPQPISDAIANYWHEGLIDFSKRAWFFVSADPRNGIVRFHVVRNRAEDVTITYPNFALCYNADSRAWWTETYPVQLSGFSKVDVGGLMLACCGARTGEQSGSAAVVALDSATEDEVGALDATVVCTWRSGLREIPPKKDPRDSQDRVIVVSYKPTTASAVNLNLRVWFDHNTIATSLAVPASFNGASTTYGDPDIAKDMSIYGSDPVGLLVFPIRVPASFRYVTHHWIGIELNWINPAEEVEIYSVDVMGVE